MDILSIPPSSSGIGTGAAQVYDTSRLVGVFGQLIQQNRLRQQQEQKAIADMLVGMRNDKLRPADLGEYNQKYTELKNLYIQNKDLYRNPLKNLEAYKKAEQLKSEMLQISADSKSQANLEIDGGRHILNKGVDYFVDGVVDKFNAMKNMPVSAIKSLNGGILPGIDIFEPEPKDINWATTDKFIDSVARKVPGGVKQISVTSRDNAPTGYMNYRVDEVYDPGAVSVGADLVFDTDRDVRRNMLRAFDNLKANTSILEAEQSELNKRLGEKTFEINDAKSYNRALAIKRMNMVQGKPDLVLDKEYAANQKEFERQKGISAQKEVALFKSGLSAQKNAGKKSGDQILWEQSGEAINLLKTANPENTRKVARVFDQYAKGMPHKATSLTPNKEKGQTVDSWIRNIRKFNLAGAYYLSDQELTQLYQNNMPVFVLPVDEAVYKEVRGKQKLVSPRTYALISPIDPAAQDKMYGLLKKYTPATITKGVAGGVERGEDEEE